MWDFRAYLTKLHDGDSLWVMVDTGFDQRCEPEIRLLDVHTPELNQPGGRECTEFVNAWFDAAEKSYPSRRWNLYLQTVQTKVYEPTQKMTFTRYLATVWPFDRRGPQDSLNYAVTLFLSAHPEWGPGQ